MISRHPTLFFKMILASSKNATRIFMTFGLLMLPLGTSAIAQEVMTENAIAQEATAEIPATSSDETEAVKAAEPAEAAQTAPDSPAPTTEDTPPPVAVAPPKPILPSINTRDRVLSGPFYSPDTKSYFALLEMPSIYGKNRWQHAQADAQQSTLFGVPGRLAVIKSYEAHAFVRDQVQPHRDSWIGLKYDCANRSLLWVDGTDADKQRFKAWHPRWHRTDITCATQSIPYMPVYYLPLSEGFRWQASGPSKEFLTFIVEYPTGKKMH